MVPDLRLPPAATFIEMHFYVPSLESPGAVSGTQLVPLRAPAFPGAELGGDADIATISPTCRSELYPKDEVMENRRARLPWAHRVDGHGVSPLGEALPLHALSPLLRILWPQLFSNVSL